MKQNKKSEEKAAKKAPVRSAPKIAATAPQTRTTRPATKAKAAAPAAVNAPSAPKTPTVTTIQAQVDVGFGNSLFIRGEGAGLSWDAGVPMENAGSSVWTWQAPAAGPVVFKVLINDQVWAKGGDITAKPGETAQVSPEF